MNKIFVLLILSLSIPVILVAYGQSNDVTDATNAQNDSAKPSLLEYVVSQYEHGIRFKDVLPVAIGILGFSYFIWKMAYFLSRREVFTKRLRYTAGGTQRSLVQQRIFYVVKYVVIFPIIMYGWVVVCFFFMYALNTSLSYDVLTLMMVGIITAARIAAHWNEKLAEDIMKFLPFNLLFTLLYNPALDFETIFSTVEQFPSIMLELTIFILFIGVLEGILKLIYFVVSKSRHQSNENIPIKPD